MKKTSRFIIVLIIVIVMGLISYFIFGFGITNKVKGSLYKVFNDDIYDQGYMPVINYTINSSGEEFVNSDVVLIVHATSIYNINKVEYSYDYKNWIEADEKINSKEVETKIIFNKTMDKDVYVRVENDRGYKSYKYKTSIKIDKELPKLRVEQIGKNIIIKTTDNLNLKYIQYSNDKENWENEEISGTSKTIQKVNFKYKYVRAVDKVGNISKIVTIKNINVDF